MPKQPTSLNSLSRDLYAPCDDGQVLVKDSSQVSGVAPANNGAGGNPFDQDLNTTDAAQFSQVTTPFLFGTEAGGLSLISPADLQLMVDYNDTQLTISVLASGAIEAAGFTPQFAGLGIGTPAVAGQVLLGSAQEVRLQQLNNGLGAGFLALGSGADGASQKGSILLTAIPDNGGGVVVSSIQLYGDVVGTDQSYLNFGLGATDVIDLLVTNTPSGMQAPITKLELGFQNGGNTRVMVFGGDDGFGFPAGWNFGDGSGGFSIIPTTEIQDIGATSGRVRVIYGVTGDYSGAVSASGYSVGANPGVTETVTTASLVGMTMNFEHGIYMGLT